MSKISTLLYSIIQGIKNIYRNRMFSLASIGTITACLFMFGIFYFLISNFQYMIKNVETNVGITVFFEEELSEEEILEIGEIIKKEKEVAEITFISATEAWERFCESNFQGEDDLKESFGEDNPLKDSASYEIYLYDVSGQDDFVNYLEGMDGVRQVNNSASTAKALSSFNILVGYVSGAIIIILLSVAVFLISTTVTMGISVRKNEISIMRLIGATDFFIRAPFIVEGILIGVLGTILPLIILYTIYNNVVDYLRDKFHLLSNLLTFLDVNLVFQTLIPVSFGIGIGIGFAGSFLTVRKHLTS